MRVISGIARSLPLRTPAGQDVRPTTDRIKETLFNILQPDIPGCVFIDLFSGSGGIGIEALSRGAKKAYFVDNAQSSLSCIQSNLAFTKFTERAVVLGQDVCAALGTIREDEADIVFMDPPYGQEQERRALEALKRARFVTENTLIVVEAALDTDFSYLDGLGFLLRREKCYKTNKHVFIVKKS